MSLINNMLKELEKREKNRVPPVYLATMQTNLTKKTNRLHYKFLLISSAIILLILFSAATLFYPSKKLSITPILKDTAKKTAEPNAKPNIWMMQGSITGITLQVKENITEITFLLNHPVLYRLNTNQMNNELSLIFYQTKLEAEIPPVTYLNTALENMTHQLNRDDSQFNLRFHPNSTIKYINLNTDNKNTELVIAIESSGTTSKPNVKSKTIKIPAMQTLLNEQYQSALDQIEKGFYQTGVQQLELLLKADPQYKDARTSLVAILLNQGHVAKANRFLEEGLDLSPNHASFLELKARIFILQNKPKDALNLLLTSAPTIVENPNYHALIASLYERNNQDLSAIKKYKQLLYLNSQNGNWWLGLGISLEKLGHQKSALTAYQKAEETGHLNATSIKFLQNRLALMQGKNYEA